MGSTGPLFLFDERQDCDEAYSPKWLHVGQVGRTRLLAPTQAAPPFAEQAENLKG